MRLIICLCIFLLSATAGFAAEGKAAWQVEWEQTVATAEKEGQVTPYIFDQGPVTVEVVQAFERAFPKIKVNQLRGEAVISARVSSRSAGRENIWRMYSLAAKERHTQRFTSAKRWRR
jgi:hypothetical protein